MTKELKYIAKWKTATETNLELSASTKGDHPPKYGLDHSQATRYRSTTGQNLSVKVRHQEVPKRNTTEVV